MKKFVQKRLAKLAHKIVLRHQPKIVAITGSVGKTSVRHAIAAVLKDKYRVRTAHARDYNNEFGIPLIIIGMDSPGRSVVGWLAVLWKAQKMVWFGDKQYPNMLVLEYGMDHPGDIDYLCDIAEPDVAVWTAVSPVHAEHFDSFEELAAEKARLVERVKMNGKVILNADDPTVMKNQGKAKVDVVTYGLNGQVRAENIKLQVRYDFNFEPGEQFSALAYDVVKGEESVRAERENILGMGAISSSLAAVAVADYFGQSLAKTVKQFEKIPVVAGRLRPLPGIKGTLVIDDSYNAAPASVSIALDVLAGFSPSGSARRIAALGKMAELGEYSKEEHRKIGQKVAATEVDLLVTVADEAIDIKNAAIEAGLSEEKVVHFDNSKDAGRWLDQEVKRGDIVLVKGSQSARMEKVVKDLMAQPMSAGLLLVRQYGKWLED